MHKEKNWKYISENTTNFLSLHDCECSHIYYKNGKLIIELVWMDVLEDHPQNPFSEAHESGNACIELINPKLINCDYYINNEKITTKDITQIDFKDILFLNFDETQKDDLFANKMFLIDNGLTDYDNLTIEISYKSSVVKFNELKKESWFVNWGNRFHYLQESEDLEEDISEAFEKLKNKELTKNEEEDLNKIIKTIIARKDATSEICEKVITKW